MQRRSFLKYALAGAGAVSVSALTGCGLVNPGGASAAGGGKTIKIIVTESAPYQEPTKIARKLLEAKGWTLEPTYVTDIIQPNLAVANDPIMRPPSANTCLGSRACPHPHSHPRDH